MNEDKIAALRADRDNMADLCLLNMDTTLNDIEAFIESRIKWHSDEVSAYVNMTCVTAIEKAVVDHKIYEHEYRKSECDIILQRIKGNE